MSKAPQAILDSIFAFAPNRNTLGGTAYLIVGNHSNILVDCPAWTTTNQDFIAAQGGIDWLVITHRQAITSAIREIQNTYGCTVVIQEQEAYLLPVPVTCFQDTLTLDADCQLLWTPGQSPGSACLHWRPLGGCLFTGRHLLPTPQGHLSPIRTSGTFHWPRQLRSVDRLCQTYGPDTLAYILPGARIGFLRGQGAIANAYEQLLACRSTAAGALHSPAIG